MRRVAFALLLITLVALPKIAEANGRFPAANQLVRRPGSQDHYMLRATFGILISNDGAKTWDWVCEQAVGYQSSKDPPVAYTAGGSMIVGTFTAVSMSTDGCQWDPIAAVPKLFVSDLTVRRDRPTTGLVLISPFAVSDGATALYDTRLFELTDDAKSGSQRHTFDPTLLGYGVETAGAAAPGRVYVTAGRNIGPQNFPVLLVSDDDGMTFIERPIPTDPFIEHSIYIAGVDPTFPDRVYLRTTGTIGPSPQMPHNRLWVTEDAGKTWKAIFTAQGMTLQPLLGFALSEDGSKVYVGGPVHGLNVASRSDFQFQKTSDIAVQCLSMFDGVLWACSSTQFALGKTTNDGKSFTPVLHLNEIRGPRSCPPSSTFNTVGADDGGLGCLALWPPVRDILMIDAGPRPDGGGGGTGGGGCGCDTSSEGAAGWLGAALATLLAGGAILWGRLRRRRS
jgi:hypothetical protein